MNISNVVSEINNSTQNTINKNSTNDSDDFGKVLAEFVSEANKTDHDDKVSNIELMTGNADNTHDSMIAAEKADISLRLTIQIRNKVLDAYNEVMRMQI